MNDEGRSHSIVFPPYRESSAIDCHPLDTIPCYLQGIKTMGDFEVWTRFKYDVVLGMSWLNVVDVWTLNFQYETT